MHLVMNYDKLLKLAGIYEQDTGSATTGAEALETAQRDPSRVEEMQRIIQYSLGVHDSQLAYKALQKGIQFANTIEGADKEALYKAVLETRKPDFVTSFASRVSGLDNSNPNIYSVLSRNPQYLYQFAKGVKGADTDRIYKTLLNIYKKDPNNRYLVWADQVKNIADKRLLQEQYPASNPAELFPFKPKEEPEDAAQEGPVPQDEEVAEKKEITASLFQKLLSLGIVNKSRV